MILYHGAFLLTSGSIRRYLFSTREDKLPKRYGREEKVHAAKKS